MMNCLSVLLNQECDLSPELSCGTILERNVTDLSSLLWSTKSLCLSIYQPYHLFSAAQISRSTVSARLLRILELVPNLLRVARTLTMHRTSWQCATPKDDHRKHNTAAMRNVCGIRLLLVVGVRELLINSFPRHLIWNGSCSKLKRHPHTSSVVSLSCDVRNCGFL